MNMIARGVLPTPERERERESSGTWWGGGEDDHVMQKQCLARLYMYPQPAAAERAAKPATVAWHGNRKEKKKQRTFDREDSNGAISGPFLHVRTVLHSPPFVQQLTVYTSYKSYAALGRALGTQVCNSCLSRLLSLCTPHHHYSISLPRSKKEHLFLSSTGSRPCCIHLEPTLSRVSSVFI